VPALPQHGGLQHVAQAAPDPEIPRDSPRFQIPRDGPRVPEGTPRVPELRPRKIPLRLQLKEEERCVFGVVEPPRARSQRAAYERGLT